MKGTSKSKMGTRRYAAKLLFQFRVMVGGKAGKVRLCEEQIIQFRSTDARSALAEAKRRGQSRAFKYHNNDGNPVYFEYIGVLELLSLEPQCEKDEVWYDLRERIRPMERRKQLIPTESQLAAIRCGE